MTFGTQRRTDRAHAMLSSGRASTGRQPKSWAEFAICQHGTTTHHQHLNWIVFCFDSFSCLHLFILVSQGPVAFGASFLLSSRWDNVFLSHMAPSHFLTPRLVDSWYKSSGLFTSRWAFVDLFLIAPISHKFSCNLVWPAGLIGACGISVLCALMRVHFYLEQHR